MDRQGNIWTPEEVQQRLGELTGAEDVPRKHSPDEQGLRDEHQVSPEVQRGRKIASERFDQASFLRKVAFRKAQQENPIKPRPRRKRGRKRR